MSLLAAAGSILGGLLGRSKPKVISAGDNFQSHIDGVMAAAAKHGFNPFTLLQNGQAIGPTVTQSDNSAFGAGVANAFALAGDALLSKRSTTAKLNQYQQQNQRLQSRVNAITLRAPVPGVYGRSRLPSDPEVYGAADPSAPSVARPWGSDGTAPRLVGQSVADRPDADWAAKVALRDSYVPTVPVSQSDQGAAPPQLPLMFLGREFKTKSRSSDAEAFEARYGEIGAEAAGAAIFADDLAYNAAYWRNQKVARHTKNWWATYRPFREAQRQGYDPSVTPFWATPDYMRMVEGR